MTAPVMQLARDQLQYWLSYQRCAVCDFRRTDFTNKLTRRTSITKLFCECEQERVNQNADFLREKLENIHAPVPFNSVCQKISGLISGVTPKLWQSKPFGTRKDLCAPFSLSSQWSHLTAKNASNYPKCQTLPSFNLWGHTEFVC